MSRAAPLSRKGEREAMRGESKPLTSSNTLTIGRKGKDQSEMNTPRPISGQNWQPRDITYNTDSTHSFTVTISKGKKKKIGISMYLYEKPYHLGKLQNKVLRCVLLLSFAVKVVSPML